MDTEFTELVETPLPSDQVRIRSLYLKPLPDGKRVRLQLDLTPFAEPPNAEIVVKNALGDELACLHIIETMMPKMEITVHLRDAELVSPYQASITIYYNHETPEMEEIKPERPINRHIVDQKKISFEI